MKQLGSFLPFILIIVVFWFLLVRPQRKRQQELRSTQSSLVPGTQVMLSSGIFGTVTSLEEETVHVELAPGTTVKVVRQAIVRVLPPETPDVTSPDPDGPAAPVDPTSPADDSDRHDQ